MAGKVLVLAANGTVGSKVVAGLVAKGEQVKAASRSGTAPAGAEGVVFDLADPATFARAFEGVDRLFLVMPSGYLDVVRLLTPLVDLAAARKVKVVFMTVFGADADESIPYRQVERALERSGTGYVILRPNWFTDNLGTYWIQGIRQGVISVPAADGKTSFIDARDIAGAAVAALTSASFDGKAFNLTGPEALSYADAARLVSEATGKTVKYVPATDEGFVALLTGAGVPAAYAEFLASIFHPVRQGWTAAVTQDVKTLTGKPPRTVAEWVRENAPRLR